MHYLVDNDVFFAAIYGNHTLHRTARPWLDGAKPSGWGVASETYLAGHPFVNESDCHEIGHLTADDAIEAVDMELAGNQ